MNQPHSDLYYRELLPARPEPRDSEPAKSYPEEAQRELNASLLDARVAFHTALAARRGMPIVEEDYIRRLVQTETDDLLIVMKLRQTTIVDSGNWSGQRPHHYIRAENNVREQTDFEQERSTLLGRKSSSIGTINRRLAHVLGWIRKSSFGR